jgi:hypothetical protein
MQCHHPSDGTTSFFSFIQLRSDVNSLPPHLMTSCSKFLRRDAGASDDDFLISQEDWATAMDAHVLPYPNRDTTTDRDTVTEDQVQGNETLMR